MNLHTLPHSAFSFMNGVANGVSAATDASTRNVAAPARAVIAVQPVSCASSGRVKASDVEAARRYYVESR